MSRPAEELRYGQVDEVFVDRLETLSPDDDGPFWMLNLMHYRDRADYPPDHPDAALGRTGQQADDVYAPVDILADLGAAIVFFGDVVEQLDDDPGARWDRVAIVRYPTVRSFVEMQDRPDFVARHVHKDAGMLRTVISLCHPVAGTLGAGRRVLVELLGPGEPPPAYDGRLVLEVAGTPVGDGRPWAHLVLTDVTASGSEPVPHPEATRVVVDALIQEMP